ncbi:MAG: Sec-independent protein translocase protein TatB [Candidatus Nanopelagicales bacterium]
MVDMMDVGWGELLLLAVVALLIFGPDKLPKAAADAGRMVRKLRELASTAQKDLSPDLDMEGLKNDLRSVADLHPKRIMSSALSDVTSPSTQAKAATPRSSAPAQGSPAPSSPSGSSARLDPDAT